MTDEKLLNVSIKLELKEENIAISVSPSWKIGKHICGAMGTCIDRGLPKIMRSRFARKLLKLWDCLNLTQCWVEIQSASIIRQQYV